MRQVLLLPRDREDKMMCDGALSFQGKKSELVEDAVPLTMIGMRRVLLEACPDAVGCTECSLSLA
jgi:hypothetical protein